MAVEVVGPAGFDVRVSLSDGLEAAVERDHVRCTLKATKTGDLEAAGHELFRLTVTCDTAGALSSVVLHDSSSFGDPAIGAEQKMLSFASAGPGSFQITGIAARPGTMDYVIARILVK